MNKAITFWQLMRHLGPGWMAYRLAYALRMRTGQVRRQMPAKAWSEQPLASLTSDPAIAEPDAFCESRLAGWPRFFFAPGAPSLWQEDFAHWDTGPRTSVQEADEAAQGIFQYFRCTAAQTGLPPDWHSNPFTGQKAPSSYHWSQIGDFDYGDIRVIWEVNRFGFAFALVRAYWRTGHERYAELYWQLVEDWRAQNSPQQGPNWKCGQEISFRIMAWCFGLYGFQGAKATTARRVADLAQMIAVSARRVEANLDYALSQHNNHGISEGMGLWTVGVLFPEFKHAARWRETGREVLESQGRELIYEDGSFAQHSANYHRLMLHDFVWALRLGDLNGYPLTADVRERVGRAGRFLYQIQDEPSGRLPNYGQNDGSLILPLNNCDPGDWRPVIQATHYVCFGSRCYEAGPWDEDLIWLFGREALKAQVAQPERHDLRAENGGCYTLRSRTGLAFVRCVSFRHRPSQADLLHVDLWWQGQPVAMDAGTYSYNAPAPWNNCLAHTACHNTVSVDGLDQMELASKFMWLPWPHGRVRDGRQSAGGLWSYWEGEHDGYWRLKPAVNHRRGILRLRDEHWLVLDLLASHGDHEYRLHWLLWDMPYQWDESRGCLTWEGMGLGLQMSVWPHGGCYSLVRADEHSPRGWYAPCYSSRAPALSADLTVRSKTALFWTLVGTGPSSAVMDGNRLRIDTGEWSGSLDLGMDDHHSLITSISDTRNPRER